MNEELQKLYDTLVEFAGQMIEASDATSYRDKYNWRSTVLSGLDLADLPMKIADKINRINIKDINPDVEEYIRTAVIRINEFKDHQLNHLIGGDNDILPSYLSLMEWVNIILQPLFNWESLQDNNLIPRNLADRIRTIASDIDSINIDKDKLLKDAELIEKAVEASESLDITLEKLESLTKKIEGQSDSATALLTKIQVNETLSKNMTDHIDSVSKLADDLMEKCEDTYKVTATRGLAKSFDDRAIRLKYSMAAWVAGLMAALVGGALIGIHNFEILSKHIDMVEPNNTFIWIQIILSFVSFGAPIWFAWISTKQINRLFKLAEDYSFKASVAKAYEGYRKEALRLDPKLELRLFGSALMRLEEAPLRLLDSDEHGSPWLELLNNPLVQKALNEVPENKDKLWDLVNSAVDSGKAAVKKSGFRRKSDTAENSSE